MIIFIKRNFQEFCDGLKELTSFCNEKSKSLSISNISLYFVLLLMKQVCTYFGSFTYLLKG